MRNLLLASLLLPLVACADPEQDPNHQQLNSSWDTWEVAKTEAADTYQYVRTASIWTGERFETTVVVSSGVVVERSYVAYDGDELTDSWTEYADDLGSHESGFEALTLDDLYSECQADVLPRADDVNSLTLTTFEDGLLQDCYTVDQSLEDSGADGISLESISLEPLSCGARGVPCG